MKKRVKNSMLNLSLVGVIGFSSATALAATPAGDEPIQLADVYVRPDYLEIQSLKDTKEIITITKKDIEGKGYANLSDVLREVPSISVDTAGRGTIDIRGQGSEGAQRNIQVLVDGAPVTALVNHPLAPDYNLVPVNNIEKIEIIPGGGSVLYGAGAVGGVINVTTNLKNLEQSKSKFTTLVSSDGQEFGTNLNFKLDSKTALNLGYNRGKQYLFFKNTYIDKDYLYAGVAHELNKGKITFRYSHLKDDGQYLYNIMANKIETYGKDYVPKPKEVTEGLDKDGHRIRKTVSGYKVASREMDNYNLSFQKDLGKRWGITSDIFYNDGYYTNNEDENKQMHHHTKGIRLKFDHGYGDDNNLLIGVDYIRQDANLGYNDYKVVNFKKGIYREVPLSFNYDKKTLGFYALNKIKKGKWTMTQGLRREKIDWGFDKNAANNLAGKGTRHNWETAAELSAAYNYNDTGRVYARWEKGYSLPDGIQISDEASINGNKIYFPTSAENEHYNNYEIGMRDKIGISTVKITAYLSTVDNQIQRMKIKGISDRSTINLVNTKRKGIDVDLSQRFGKLKVSEALTFLKGESHYTQAGLAYLKTLEDKRQIVDYTKSGLKYVPTRKATIKLDYDFTDKTSMGLRWTYFGKYNNFIDEKDNNEKNIMAGHSITDLYWRHKENKYVEFYGGISNLFNKRYYRYAGQNANTLYIGQERNYYVGLNYNF